MSAQLVGGGVLLTAGVLLAVLSKPLGRTMHAFWQIQGADTYAPDRHGRSRRVLVVAVVIALAGSVLLVAAAAG